MVAVDTILAFADAFEKHPEGLFALYLAAIPMLGLAAQWIAWRTRLPGILLLLVFGIALGYYVRPDEVISKLAGGAVENAPSLLLPIVSLSVAIILFAGGLSLRFSELTQAGATVFWLVTVGAAISLVATTIAAQLILDFDLRVSLLLGAILVVTGPTVIVPMLRQIRPSRRVASVLRWEGIVIDPIGAMLAVLVFEELLAVGGRADVVDTVVLLIQIVGTGALLGTISAFIIVQCLRRYWVPDHLHGLFSLSIALVAFAVSNLLADESGLIAVTVLGVLMANQKKAVIEHVTEYKEHLTILLIGCLFIVLGSRLEISDLTQLGWPGLLFVAVLVLVVRPLSAFISTIGSKLTWQERLFTASLAPRGIVAAAVASVFALKLEAETGVDAGWEQAQLLVPVTFSVILGTVIIYGLGAGPIARLLGLSQPNPQGVLFAGAEPAARAIALALKKVGVPVLMVDTNFNKVTAARMDELPAICANILNEHAKDELNLAGIGRMFAMTPNDEVNTLAIRECRNLFGSAGLYQIAPKAAHTNSRRGLSHHLRGRILFGADLTFTKLESLLENGAQIKSTSLTESHTYQDFLDRYGEEVYLLFSVDEDGILRINTQDQTLKPQAGSTITAIVGSMPIPANHPSQDADSDEQKAESAPRN